VMAWLLSSGPGSLSFLSPYLETALASEDGSYAIRLEDTILTWSRENKTVEIRLRGAQAVGASGAIVADIPELALSLSATALMQGKLAPRSLSVFGPGIVVLRRENGSFEFGLPKSGQSSAKVVAAIVAELLEPPDRNRTFGYLNRVKIVGGDLVIDDKRSGVVWEAPKTDITLVRGEDGIRAQAEIRTVLDGKAASFAVDADYIIADKRLSLTVGLIDARPDVLVRLFPNLKSLAAVDLPISGTLSADLTLDGTLDSLEFNLSGGPGVLTVPGQSELAVEIETIKTRGSFSRRKAMVEIAAFEVKTGGKQRIPLPDNKGFALPIKSLTAKATYFSDFERLEVKSFMVDLAGPTAGGTVTLRQIGENLTFDIDAHVLDAKFETLSRYWPPAVSPIVRPWVLANMKVGDITRTQIGVVGKWNKKDGPEIEFLAGDMVFEGVSLNYLPPMPIATEGKGRARFNQQTFDIMLTGGKGPGVNIPRGRVLITELDKFDQFADIDLVLEGSLGAGLSLIDQKPLEFAKAVGLNPKSASGDVSTELKIKFLLERATEAEDVEIAAVATINNASVPDIIRGMDLSDGQLKLSADNKGMTLRGSVKLGSIDAALEWRENFEQSAGIATEYQITGRLNSKQWSEELGLDFVPFTPEFMEGDLDANLFITRDEEGRGALTVNLDLGDVEMRLPQLGWKKEKGKPANAEVEAHFSTDKFLSIPRFTLDADKLSVAGAVGFDEKGDPSRIDFNKMIVDKSDVTVVAIPRQKDWDIDLRGAKLDLVKFLEFEETDDKDGKSDVSVTLSLNVDRVQVSPETELKRVSGVLEFGEGIVKRAKIAASVGDNNETLQVDLVGEGQVRKVKATSSDAGAVFRTFDLSDNIVGGKLTLDATIHDTLPHAPMTGRLTVGEFRVIKAPLLARIVSVVSLTGILDALSGDGLAFSQLDAPFNKLNDLITVKDAKASGITLGITMSGLIDLKEDELDLAGTIVPAYALNSALGRIPVIGPLFTGGEKGGGIFAATYKLKGKAEKPEVSVNPLSALAPSFLRNLFGIFDEKSDSRVGNGNPKAPPTTN
ncbi:MAG: AsmA-like C-terminal domain-containing protein, partial [Proteobacteria bacterium]|nr:AsmA-like C-terminal domain-containing protein [Pseudomonadota bacterium]